MFKLHPLRIIILLILPLIFYSCGQKGYVDEPEDFEIPVDLLVSNFGLYDHTGDFHNLYYHSDAAAIVIMIQGNSCPIVRNAITDYKAVRDQFADQNVLFYMLNSNIQDNRNSIAVEAADFGIDIPILVDETQLVGESLGLFRTAEVLVINPKNWKLAYRGPVNDRIGYESQRNEASNNYLTTAIEATIKGEELPEKMIKGMGCLVNFPNRNKREHSEISYEQDIAPLLIENCTKCHVEGGIAPWAMTSYEMVRGWSPMIREVLRVRRMPPWQADPHYGQFANDLSLTNEEIQTLVHWVEAGAKKGEGESDPLKGVEQNPPEWSMGEPDLVFQLDPEVIPATGVLDYRYQEFEISSDKDLWAKAVQIIPGNTSVLHHVLVSITYPDGFKAPMEVRSRWLDGLFASWAPGGEAEVFPEGTGRVIPKGSKILFQLHYTTSGKEETDAPKLGIYTQDHAPEKEYMIVGPFNTRIQIPPYEGDYRAAAKQVFEKDLTLYGMAPHMHFRGKSMKYTAKYPDGTTEVLLNVPNYNFNWQRYYQLDEPKYMPAGSEIIVEAVYDNSKLNTFNPHPDQTVTWGEQSFDEMLIGYMSFHYGKAVDAGAGDAIASK
ncbi:MAG: redoxin domain-containing protein [Bacteroidia bacterium]|nr:redoxin domain-containing protein [Bacteroidia bacterium]